MTINVTGPDGSNISFPDGTPHADIVAAMDKHFGASGPKVSRETPGMIEGTVRALAEGVPVLGGLVNKADAATNAAISYANKDVKGTWAERYAEAKRLQDEKSKAFEQEHPIVSTIANVVGGVGAGGALLKAAPAVGARVLGLTGETLPAQIRQGIVSGGAIGGLDALTRGEDAKTGAEVGAITGAAGPLVGRAVAKGVEAVRGFRQPPHVPTNEVDIAGVKVPRTVGQATGDADSIMTEQAALRNSAGQREQQVARDYFDMQKQRLEDAQEAVAGKMSPTGAVHVRTPQEGGDLVAAQLAENNRTQQVALRQTAQALAEEGRGIHAAAGGQQSGATLMAANPLEAAGIVSHSVGAAAENAQAATRAAYDAMKRVPGKFHPASFNKVDEEIVGALNRGSEPVRVNPQTTPQAANAVNDLADVLSGIRQSRDEAGRIIPKPPLTAEVIDEARKRLNTFYGDALQAARSSNNWSDVRAMRRVMDAFDDAVEKRLRDGRFIGDDPQAVLNAFESARGAHSAYRKMFTSQGAGDEVGAAIQKIVGRYEGQAMPPEQVRSTLYGNGALPIKIAQRFMDMFGGRGSQEIGAIKQGYYAHLTQDALGNPLAPEKAADNLQKAMRSTLGQVYFTAPERQRINAYADRLRASIPGEPSDIDTIVRRVATGETNAADLVAKINSVKGGGQQERLIERLKTELNPEQFAAVKQMQWRWLNEHNGGPLDVGSRRVFNRIDDFIETPAAKALYSNEERALLRAYSDLMKEITPPSGTVNYSNTASVLGKMFRGGLDALFGGVGFAIHPVGAAAAYGADRAQTAIRDVTRAAKVAKLLYGTPQGVNAIADLQRKLGNLASFAARTTQPALLH